MLRIALVEYINTRPFLDGLEKHFQAEEVELITLSPSACGIALKEGKCDLALIPVGSIPELSKLEILPNYCIGSNGPVESVFIFSQQPLEQCNRLILDTHSRSSNGLARILLAQHWKLSPELIMPDSRDFSLLTGGTAGVVIGDQAIRLRENYAHVYDLSQAWQEMTGLPFAFAVWASHQGRLTPIWRQRLNAAFADGVQQAAESATKWAEHFDIDPVFAHQYLTQHIDFRFTAERHRALHLYLHHLQSLPSLANHELHHIRP
jgi:chorismate dehydratase